MANDDVNKKVAERLMKLANDLENGEKDVDIFLTLFPYDNSTDTMMSVEIFSKGIDSTKFVVSILAMLDSLPDEESQLEFISHLLVSLKRYSMSKVAEQNNETPTILH